MNKRQFLKMSGTMITALYLSPLIGCKSSKKDNEIYNWARNYKYSTNDLSIPKNTEEVKKLVSKKTKLKAIGTKHSFNNIADSRDALLSTENLKEIILLDRENLRVKVGAGIKYGDLSVYLQQEGYALHNMASLPHISVAGACATATHGSGTGNLTTALLAFEMIKANGELITISKAENSEEFNGMAVSLGAFGIITSMTLQIEPTYMVRQDVYLDLPIEKAKENFEKIIASGYSVSLFTDWNNKVINEVWIKNRVNNNNTNKFSLPKNFYGATAAKENVHPILGVSPENCTDQMGVPGPWNERLAHFKMGFTPSKGEELQSEYFIAIENAVEAMTELEQLSKEIKPLLFMGEIRTILADEFWMSTAYKRNSVAFHFTWKPKLEAVLKLLPKIEEKLERFSYRPHHAKLFTTKPNIFKSRYEMSDSFKNLAIKYDPEGKFKNEFLEKYLF